MLPPESDSTTDLVRALIALRQLGAAHSVEIRADDVTTTLRIEQGEIVGVRASKPGEPLGRLLVRRGLLTQEQYADVLERMTAALEVGEKVRFGEVAVELAYVSEEHLAKCLEDQRRALAARVFQGAAPSWTVRKLTAGDAGAARETPLQIEALFIEAVRSLDEARQGAIALDRARPYALRMVWPLDEIDSRFELTRLEAERVRVALAGDRSVAELLDAKAVEELDVRALLTALIASGAAATRERGVAEQHTRSTRPPPVRPSLPAAASATFDAARVRSAFAKIKKVASEDAPPPSSVPDRATQSLQQVLRSEQAFQRGRALFRTAELAAALVELERALELEPSSKEYALFVSWTRHETSGKKLGGDQGATLELLARAALRADPKLAFGYFVLGEVLQSEGKSEEARRHLRHALRLEPTLFEGVRARRIAAMRGSRPSIPEAVADASDATAKASSTTPTTTVIAAVETPAIGSAQETESAATATKDAPLAAVTPLAVSIDEEPPARRAPSTSTQDATNAVTSQEEPTPPRSRRRRGLALLAAAVIVPGAIVTFLAWRAPGVPADARQRTLAASTSAATASARAIPADVPVAATASAVAATPASAPASASSGAPSDLDARTGALRLPKSASGHRVFIDGRVVSVEGDRITLRCGRHDVRIGSRGATLAVDVPCDAETVLP